MNESVLAASRQAMKQGSRSFFLASQLLPPNVRAGVQLLYAWCRHCDDTIDGQRRGHGGPAPTHDAGRALAELVDHTERALGDGPATGVPFLALRRVVRHHDIPAFYVREHLRGFAMDVDRVQPATVDEVVAYAYRVAGVVGVMMAWLMAVRDSDTLDRAADLGIAFQLTNIARDVMDDATAGRRYLPDTLLPPDGLDPAHWETPAGRAALARAATSLLDEAEGYYRSAVAGIDRLPLRLAWSIESASRVYRAIGVEIRRRGPRAWDRRVVVPTARKLTLVAAAAVAVLWRRSLGRRRHPPRTGLWPIPEPPAADRPDGAPTGPPGLPNAAPGPPAAGP